jgi:hypothetical protein
MVPSWDLTIGNLALDGDLMFDHSDALRRMEETLW